MVKLISPIFIDTPCFIYLVEAQLPWANIIEPIISQISSGKYTALTSIFTITETLTKPLKFQTTTVISRFSDTFNHLPNLSIVTPNTATAISAANIRAQYGFTIIDSFQLALAQENNCTTFLTNDHQLVQFPSLKVVCLSDLDRL